MKSIQADFARWDTVPVQTIPRFDLSDVNPDEVWDDVPTVELCHELDHAPCELCGGPCCFVTGGES